MFGVSSFSAVINPPQACILAVSAGVPRVVTGDDGQLVIFSIILSLDDLMYYLTDEWHLHERDLVE